MTVALDRNGRVVRAAARVRIITVPATLLESIPEDESRVLKRMIDQVFTVDEVSDDGLAWVEFWQSGETGCSWLTCFGLAPSEMELV